MAVEDRWLKYAMAKGLRGTCIRKHELPPSEKPPKIISLDRLKMSNEKA
jgi:hypothetical protein